MRLMMGRMTLKVWLYSGVGNLMKVCRRVRYRVQVVAVPNSIDMRRRMRHEVNVRLLMVVLREGSLRRNKGDCQRQ